eukprot:6189092-Pleurochrysis_carterae.AAC.1
MCEASLGDLVRISEAKSLWNSLSLSMSGSASAGRASPGYATQRPAHTRPRLTPQDRCTCRVLIAEGRQ